MVALNQNRISPSPSSHSSPIRRQTPPQNNSTSPTPIRLFLRARYYDPYTAEFISPDPLEYVDGMSLFRGYFVPNGLDSDGELTISCNKPIEKNCGGVKHVCRWIVDADEEDGYIIQKVCFDYKVEKCPDGSEPKCQKMPDPTNKIQNCPDNCYLEYWRVGRKNPREIEGWDGVKYNRDTFAFSNCPNSYGHFTQRGESVFIPTELMEEVLPGTNGSGTNVLEEDFGINDRGVAWAGSLRSACYTGRPKQLWDEASKNLGIAVRRETATEWSCCDDVRSCAGHSTADPVK